MEFNDNKAIYLQISDLFFDEILMKKWNDGDRIPSVRELAINIEVNPNTVMRTFSYLQEKGIIFNKRGIGYFLADDAYKITLKLRKEEFIKEELPQIFKTIRLLNLDFSDLEQLYLEYKKNK
ncbi:MAG: GntR family transcriptional regulator [Marinilabiliales bacterium]|nr:MAG: GntR family transcriptional regulator [Marinilabiliales bacterium]